MMKLLEKIITQATSMFDLKYYNELIKLIKYFSEIEEYKQRIYENIKLSRTNGKQWVNDFDMKYVSIKNQIVSLLETHHKYITWYDQY
jgi:hypothetical protein